LILKVGGGCSTPEHSDSPGPSSSGPFGALDPDESSTSLLGVSPLDITGESTKHKKAKKKKKKKEKDREKHEKKHKHHHKVNHPFKKMILINIIKQFFRKKRNVLERNQVKMT